MSYTELESGYQGLRQQNRPGFYMGHDGNVAYVSSYSSIYLFLYKKNKECRIVSNVSHTISFENGWINIWELSKPSICRLQIYFASSKYLLSGSV